MKTRFLLPRVKYKMLRQILIKFRSNKYAVLYYRLKQNIDSYKNHRKNLLNLN